MDQNDTINKEYNKILAGDQSGSFSYNLNDDLRDKVAKKLELHPDYLILYDQNNQAKEWKKINNYVLKILKENHFSNEAKRIIENASSNNSFNTVVLDKDKREIKILFSKNFFHELEKFISIAKNQYNATIFKGDTNLQREAINIKLGLDFPVDSDIPNFESIL